MNFLNKWRGKRIMFVGDSLSLNMWESLSCMLHASVPNATTTFVRREALSTVTFQVSFFSVFSSLSLFANNTKTQHFHVSSFSITFSLSPYPCFGKLLDPFCKIKPENRGPKTEFFFFCFPSRFFRTRLDRL